MTALAIRSAPLGLDRPIIRTVSACTIVAALAIFAFVAVLLVARRLAGALQQPLPGLALVQLALGVALALVLLRLLLLPQVAAALHPFRWSNANSVGGWIAFMVPSVALAALLAALMIPGTAVAAGACAWVAAAAVEGVLWWQVARQMPAEASAAPVQISAVEAAQATSDEESYPPGLVQQLTRLKTEAGERIHAVLRAVFPPGEQLQVLHVSFCPPLDAVPRLEAFAVGEAEAEARVTHGYTYGARLEVELLAAAAEPVSVVVEVSGRS